jgi:hypothetical protein
MWITAVVIKTVAESSHLLLMFIAICRNSYANGCLGAAERESEVNETEGIGGW